MVHKVCNTKLHKCTLKKENQPEKRSFGKKMTKGKKVGPNDAHRGGVHHKKGIDQARSGTKKPVCRIYAHGVRRVAHSPPPRSHLIVQCGDAKAQDPPSPQLVHFMCPSKFQQRGSSTCLIDAFCSAMDEFGCGCLVEELRVNPLSNQISAANKNIWGDFVRLINI
jgi:hypothetical protein